jgi:arginase family enzyme
MSRVISIIGAPSSAGAYAPGQEKAPGAFRRHGLASALARTGYEIADRGDVSSFRWRPDFSRENAMNLDAVAGTARALADKMADAMAAGEAALILGGDCTVELGTVAGALRGESSVGLVYIDFDTDLNPPEASDGALDWTGVAHLLDIKARHERLLIHLDVDVLSYTHCPIAENVRRCNGLTLSELSTLLTPLLAAPNWRALTITEVNPDHAPDEAEIFSQLIGTLCGAFLPQR